MVAGDKIFVAKVHELGGAVAEAFLVPLARADAPLSLSAAARADA